ncbi:MAG: V-type ATP synthase subunit D [Lentisphaerae bacterium]|jgi:V/A-type H+-transporting ATPase subunit D|nr:V-type ATP synthase subunit D [Lentisphaerota bacterium]
MAKVKLTKNELKFQRDALKRFERYLPTLQLKKQQLQMEVRHVREEIAGLDQQVAELTEKGATTIALLAGPEAAGLSELLSVSAWRIGERNVAGIDVPVFLGVDFNDIDYDLFLTPPWFDDALAMARKHIELKLRRQLFEEMLALLEQELRVVTQRVNLFEKVKIPETKENIRMINIYLGDQQTNSVGRSKIAKGKCAQRNAALQA